MSSSILDHQPGCSPLKPCKVCEAITFLRSKLRPEDMRTFVGICAPDNTGNSQANLDSSLDDMQDKFQFSVRTWNCLRNEDVTTVRQLIAKNRAELLRMPNFGRRSLIEIEVALEKIGLKLADSK